MRGLGFVGIIVLLTLAVAVPVGAETGAPLYLVLDKAMLVQLTREAGTIVVSNPKVVDVQLSAPRTLLMTAKTVGESSLIVLDGAQREVLSLPVVVIPESNRTVSVTRNCGGTTAGCAPEDELSCAPRCVRVASPGLSSGGGAAGEKSGGGGAAAEKPSGVAGAAAAAAGIAGAK